MHFTSKIKRRRSALSPACLVVFAFLSTLQLTVTLAGEKSAPSVPLKASAHEENPGGEASPIQDNSFLVEEAYNQEFGVVQHINTLSRAWTSRQWLYSFTQEWPIPGQTHQLSYTFSYLDPGIAGVSPGIGDFALNYRYQLKGSGETRVAIAPRITLLLPSGDSRLGRGFGGVGLQTNFPLSWVMSKHLVTHWNIGGTLVPAAKNALDDRAAATGYNLGQSFVWLVRPRFNALLETTWIRSQAVVSRNRVASFHDLLLSPGVRWAYNFRSGLQIVPGIAIPVGLGPSAGEKGVFVYLSFEHPFRESRR